MPICCSSRHHLNYSLDTAWRAVGRDLRDFVINIPEGEPLVLRMVRVCSLYCTSDVHSLYAALLNITQIGSTIIALNGDPPPSRQSLNSTDIIHRATRSSRSVRRADYRVSKAVPLSGFLGVGWMPHRRCACYYFLLRAQVSHHFLPLTPVADLNDADMARRVCYGTFSCAV